MSVTAKTQLGALCKRGHDHEGTGKSLRYASGGCVVCTRARSRDNRKPGRRSSPEYQRRWRADNPDRVRAHKLLSNYGITQDAYDALLKGQHGLCAICRTRAKRFNVDHDHATGKVRGLLCGGCNRGIGHLGDDADRVLAAAIYLFRQRHRQ